MEIHQDPVPLRMDEAGAIRVGKTRVLFVLVLQARWEEFRKASGMTAWA
jgi:hypothetical protein